MKFKLLLVAAVSVASLSAFGQASQANKNGAMGSPNAKGVQIQGNTDISAATSNTSAVATGENNVAKNTAGAIKGGTQIQGNTKISGSQAGSAANVSGKNNKSTNEAGVIGGN
jgi:hypothetical protein